MRTFNHYLTEGKEKSVVLTFGRFNPPTTGHQLLLDKVAAVARSKGIPETRVYPSQSSDPKKNPLKWDEKIRFLRKAFPKANIVKDRDAKTIFHVLKKLSDSGYTYVVLVVGSDRVSEFDKQISKYIGNTDTKTGLNFNRFLVVSAGERDPDADDVSGMSASKLRQLAIDGDFARFRTGVPSSMSHNDVRDLYDLLRDRMQVTEDCELDEVQGQYFMGPAPTNPQDFTSLGVEELVTDPGMIDDEVVKEPSDLGIRSESVMRYARSMAGIHRSGGCYRTDRLRCAAASTSSLRLLANTDARDKRNRSLKENIPHLESASVSPGPKVGEDGIDHPNDDPGIAPLDKSENVHSPVPTVSQTYGGTTKRSERLTQPLGKFDDQGIKGFRTFKQGDSQSQTDPQDKDISGGTGT